MIHSSHATLSDHGDIIYSPVPFAVRDALSQSAGGLRQLPLPPAWPIPKNKRRRMRSNDRQHVSRPKEKTRKEEDSFVSIPYPSSSSAPFSPPSSSSSSRPSSAYLLPRSSTASPSSDETHFSILRVHLFPVDRMPQSSSCCGLKQKQPNLQTRVPPRASYQSVGCFHPKHLPLDRGREAEPSGKA